MGSTDARVNTSAINPATEAVSTSETEIDLVDLFFKMLESWKLIVVSTLLAAFLMGVYTIGFIKPRYEATAKIYVMNSSDSAINLSDLQIGSYLTSDYQEVFKTWEVHEQVIQNLNLTYTYTQLQDMLSISNPSNTRLLYITANTRDAKEAAALANEYATVACQYIKETMSAEEPSLFSTALVNRVPVSPNKTRNIVLGALIGMIIAAGIVFLRFMLDDKIKSPEDILKYADMPTLSVVPIMGQKKK